MDRQTRKGLKTDKFAQEVTHGFQFLTEHSAETKRYSAIAVAVIALAVGIYFYNRHETTARGEALAHALRFDDATVGANVQPANLHFNTQAEKDAASFVKAHASQTGPDVGSTPYAVGVFDTVAAVGWLHFTASWLIKKLPFVAGNYDMHFVPDIPFARHALAIDEYRRDFERVPWGGSKRYLMATKTA